MTRGECWKVKFEIRKLEKEIKRAKREGAAYKPPKIELEVDESTQTVLQGSQQDTSH